MTIKISENIKRLRRNKNVTQEQIAEMLGVSVTAVSKWERGETYPDITMLGPLARYFGVTLDELMGYDEAKEKAEIHALRLEYRELYKKDDKKASEFIENVYRKYPDNYWVMNDYMWNKAGDYADNDRENLLEKKDEFLAICNKILEGCTAENLRLDAYNMMGKILNADGKTEEALALYRSKFPSWYQTWEQRSEQLFSKDTAEFKKQLITNLYELSRFAADKKIKQIWFCEEGTPKEKSKKVFDLCDSLERLRKETGTPETVLTEYWMLLCQYNEINRWGGDESDMEEYRARRRRVALLCNEYAEKEPIAKQYIKEMYGKDIL